MKRNQVAAACLATLLAGCGTLSGKEESGKRVPANPADFNSKFVAPADAEAGFRAERAAMTATITQLRDEVKELKLLFRLKTVRLDGEPEPEAKSAAVRPTTSATDAFARPRSTQPSASPIAAPPPAPVPRVTIAPAAPAVREAPPAPAPASSKPSPTYTALFRFGSTNLDETAVAALESMRWQLRDAQRVQVNAYADNVGPEAANARIAQLRAQAVEAELVRLGVPRERITTSSAVTQSGPPPGAMLLGLFRSPEAMSRRVDVAVYQTALR